MYSWYHANNQANLFFVKIKCCNLSSNLETTKPKEARISRKVILNDIIHACFSRPLIMRHKLDAISFCSDDWFETGCTNNRANCSLHFFRTDNCEKYNSNVELTKSSEDNYTTCNFPKMYHLHLFLVTPLRALYYQGLRTCGLRKFQGPDFESSKQIN